MSLQEIIKQARDEAEQERNLRGMTQKSCPKCKGKGGFSYDSYTTETENCYQVCPACEGFGVIEIPCSDERVIAAVLLEIQRHKAAIKALRHRLKKLGLQNTRP